MYGKTYMHMVDLPVNFQLGLQLNPIFRPFVNWGLVPAAIVQGGDSFNKEIDYEKNIIADFNDWDTHFLL